MLRFLRIILFDISPTPISGISFGSINTACNLLIFIASAHGMNAQRMAWSFGSADRLLPSALQTLTLYSDQYPAMRDLNNEISDAVLDSSFPFLKSLHLEETFDSPFCTPIEVRAFRKSLQKINLHLSMKHGTCFLLGHCELPGGGHCPQLWLKSIILPGDRG
ncbi:hypothetical protein BDV12DRAFT_29116 [Aspergillus spectabilis]